MTASRRQGFTLLELMIALAILAILAAVALPSYDAYITRSRLTAAFENLSAYRLRMEQAYQDNGNYGAAACAVAVPAAGSYFSYGCVLSDDAQQFVATATGTDRLAGYSFTLDDAGNRRTTAFPGATVPAACWLQRKGDC